MLALILLQIRSAWNLRSECPCAPLSCVYPTRSELFAVFSVCLCRTMPLKSHSMHPFRLTSSSCQCPLGFHMSLKFHSSLLFIAE